MADKNIQIKQRNTANDGWDNLYPKTKGAMVETSTGTVDEHVLDTTKHITAAERTAWNAKQAALGYTAENTAKKGVANGYAGLGADGKIPNDQLPALAITDTFVASSEAAMLALAAEVGDVCVRTDLSKSFILKTTGAGTLANWQELLTPPAGVSSVNGKTGAVTLTTTDVSEGTNKYYTEARVSANADVAAAKTHAGTAHAPATAQKNSDITKAEIEAKLTGTISSHGHAAAAITQDASNRFVTDAEKATWNTQQKAITVSTTEPTGTAVGELYFEVI
ncbi:hypothetical protein [Sporomusa sp.]|uniref:hypothetical protein n=1 Tax=Sporomusa sp. TaxID=2078658 RepID=UPI002CF03A0C|nr:hypothetical protein [Sporomusa sp.]HWR07739.1 hypothetical protein [Sporomusa sp.]